MLLRALVRLLGRAGAADDYQLPVRVIGDDLEVCLTACQLVGVDRHRRGLAGADSALTSD